MIQDLFLFSEIIIFEIPGSLLTNLKSFYVQFSNVLIIIIYSYFSLFRALLPCAAIFMDSFTTLR